MAVSSLSLLDKYASTFRKMIQAKILGGKGPVKQLLKLGNDTDYDFLIAAMDIIGDASSAIAHFQQFGLSGPTKYDDIGEKYLRLYGLLSATYIQQQSVLTIYRLMNVPDLTKMKAQFENLRIRELRHKLSSHSTDYFDKKRRVKEAYLPLRIDLGDRNITAVRHSPPMQHEKIDLSDAIQRHLELMIDVLDSIIEKSIKTLFKGHHKKEKDFSDALSELRVEKAGGLVIKGPKGAPRFIITFVGSKG